MAEPRYDATVERLGKDGKEIHKAPDDKFDPVYTEAEKLYKGEEFKGELPEVMYQLKDAYITKGPVKGYLKEPKNDDDSTLVDNFNRLGLKKGQNDKPNEENDTNNLINIVKKGLALIANRNMHASRFFSYPKTYLIYNDNKVIDQEKNLLDYQRIIILTHGKMKGKYEKDQTEFGNKVDYVIVSVVNISPYATNTQIDYSVTHFHIGAVVTTSEPGAFFRNYDVDHVVPKIEITKIFKHFNLGNATLNELTKFSKKYLLKNFLTSYENTKSTTLYLKPINELYFAALYLVDYYSRNLESPSSQQEGQAHKTLTYICNNIDQIKTVWKAAMHLGILVAHAPVNPRQHKLPVPSDVFDAKKVELIDGLFAEKKN